MQTNKKRSTKTPPLMSPQVFNMTYNYQNRKGKIGLFSDPNLLITQALLKMQRKTEVGPLFPLKNFKLPDTSQKISSATTSSVSKINFSSSQLGFMNSNMNKSTALEISQQIKSSQETSVTVQKVNNQRTVSSLNQVLLNQNILALLEKKQNPVIDDVMVTLKKMQGKIARNSNFNNQILMSFNQQLLQKCGELIKIAENNQKNETQSTSSQRQSENIEKLIQQLQEEKKCRLMVEEQTYKMISQQVREIEKLEQKIKYLEIQLQQPLKKL